MTVSEKNALLKKAMAPKRSRILERVFCFVYIKVKKIESHVTLKEQYLNILNLLPFHSHEAYLMGAPQNSLVSYRESRVSIYKLDNFKCFVFAFGSEIKYKQSNR